MGEYDADSSAGILRPVRDRIVRYAGNALAVAAVVASMYACGSCISDCSGDDVQYGGIEATIQSHTPSPREFMPPHPR